MPGCFVNALHYFLVKVELLTCLQRSLSYIHLRTARGSKISNPRKNTRLSLIGLQHARGCTLQIAFRILLEPRKGELLTSQARIRFCSSDMSAPWRQKSMNLLRICRYDQRGQWKGDWQYQNIPECSSLLLNKTVGINLATLKDLKAFPGIEWRNHDMLWDKLMLQAQGSYARVFCECSPLLSCKGRAFDLLAKEPFLHTFATCTWLCPSNTVQNPLNSGKKSWLLSMHWIQVQGSVLTACKDEPPSFLRIRSIWHLEPSMILSHALEQTSVAEMGIKCQGASWMLPLPIAFLTTNLQHPLECDLQISLKNLEP